VSHIDDPDEFIKSGWYWDSTLNVERSIYIDDVLYTISDELVQLNSLSDLTQLGRVKLP
jgi:uncharacterized secreted protein with C-terminal beta-propeller domain